MTTLSFQQAYQYARNAGFNEAEAVVMVATAQFESSLNTNPGGNGGGLFQFEPSTWSGTHVSCSIGDPQCQFTAARNLTSGGFYGSWYSNWFACEAAQGPGGMVGSCSPGAGAVSTMLGNYSTVIARIEQSLGFGAGKSGAASLINGKVEQAPATGTTSGGGIGSVPVVGGAANAVGGVASTVLGIPGTIASAIGGAAGGVGGAIGAGITGAGIEIGKRVLPYLIIVGGILIVLVFIGKELTDKVAPPMPSGGGASPSPGGGRPATAGKASLAEEAAVAA